LTQKLYSAKVAPQCRWLGYTRTAKGWHKGRRLPRTDVQWGLTPPPIKSKPEGKGAVD